MLKLKRILSCAVLMSVVVLVACTPALDWREVHGKDVPFTVLLPAKPASFSRMINLEGQPVMMTMTAAEVDGVTYAVGTVVMPDAEKARVALTSMKSALVKNIAGTINFEKSSIDKDTGVISIEVDALGSSQANSNARPMRLVAHFFAKNKQVYQVVVVGRENAVTHEALDTFFTSFKPD